MTAVAMTTLVGCVTTQQELRRAEAHLGTRSYEEALVWLEHLHTDLPDMSQSERARYYYLRGMASFELGARRDARHYLALARESDPGRRMLPERWLEHMDRALGDLGTHPVAD